MLTLIVVALNALCAILGAAWGHDLALRMLDRAAVTGEPLERRRRTYRVEDITEAYPPVPRAGLKVVREERR